LLELNDGLEKISARRQRNAEAHNARGDVCIGQAAMSSGVLWGEV